MTESREAEVKILLQEWTDQQNHDRCWYYPELFEKLLKIFDITPSSEIKLPLRSEFREGCRRFEEEQYKQSSMSPEDIVAQKAILEFRKLGESFNQHHNNCETCLKAARLRFAGGTTAEINARRCEEGRVLATTYQEMYNDDSLR